jgi:hypothetical protein
MDLLEDQENAVQAIAVHLSVGQDFSPVQLEAMLQLKRRFEETRRHLEAMIKGWATSEFSRTSGLKSVDW